MIHSISPLRIRFDSCVMRRILARDTELGRSLRDVHSTVGTDAAFLLGDRQLGQISSRSLLRGIWSISTHSRLCLIPTQNLG